MSEIDTLRLNGGMTPRGIPTGGPSLDAMLAQNGGRRALERLRRSPDDPDATRALERNLARLEDAVRAAPGLAPRYEGLIGELRDALQTQLAPAVTTSARATRGTTREARTAIRRGHPQRAARILIGGRDAASLRRMNVEPRELDARLRNAGFHEEEITEVRAALDAEIGRRFQRLVRADALRLVERLERQLDRATAGDPHTLQRLEDELFSVRGPDLVQRMHLAGADEEAHALDRLMLLGQHEGVRPLLRSALSKMLPIVREQAELIRRGDEGLADAWGSAYRAFETSVRRVARRLGMNADPSAALKNESVLEGAIHRSVVESRARHREAVDTARAVFDFFMNVSGYGFVSGLREVAEQAVTTGDARRRAVSGNGTTARAREAEVERVVGSARAVGEGALGSLVKGMVSEMIADAGVSAEVLSEEIESVGDRVYERLQRMELPVQIPERDVIRWLVRQAVDELMGDAIGGTVPREQIERALRG